MLADLQKFAIPQAVSIVSGCHDLPKVVLHHPSGAGAEVYLHGGHITSWTNTAGEDLFFISRESYFEPGRAIRGGIPVIFPQFGGSGPLPQHGFARNATWELIHTALHADGTVAATLALTDSPDTLTLWPHQFRLELDMQLAETALDVVLRATNTGNAPFTFTTALHTYFHVADIHQTAVSGLQGVTFIDSLRDDLREVETRPAIHFAGETDRIYLDAPNQLCIDDAGNRRAIIITKSHLPDVVVWNPWVAKSQRMRDFGDDEYLQMVCVETGGIETPVALPAGGEWQGQTTFQSA